MPIVKRYLDETSPVPADRRHEIQADFVVLMCRYALSLDSEWLVRRLGTVLGACSRRWAGVGGAARAVLTLDETDLLVEPIVDAALAVGAPSDEISHLSRPMARRLRGRGPACDVAGASEFIFTTCSETGSLRPTHRFR